jgi:hypothetical protein
MKNKYFEPDITELRVGYEIESHEYSEDEAGIPELNYDRWVKMPLTKQYLQTILKYGVSHIRVPYLTTEQIEAEGWIIKDVFRDGGTTIFEKDNFVLHWYGSNKMIQSNRCIFFENKSTEKRFTLDILFKSEIKDINTFRYIVEILGIKY